MQIRDDKSSFYFPANVKTFSINSDLTNENIDLGNFLSVELKYSFNISLNGKVSSAELFIPNSSINNYLYCENSSDCSISENQSLIEFKNISGKSGYYLDFSIDGKFYYYNSETESLESGVNWVAFDENDTQVCPINQDDWNCEWSNSINWTWKPDIPSLDLSNLDGNTTLDISLPQESKLSGIIQFGSDFANHNFYLTVYKLDSAEYIYLPIMSDENGDLNISANIPPMENYRVEIFGDFVHYVLDFDGSSYQLIFNSNSWKSDVFGAKTSTLINLTEDFYFGTLQTSTLNKVNFAIENSEENESIFVMLSNDENYFYGDVENNAVSISTQDGTYKVAIYTSKHNSGYLTNQTDNILSDVAWDWLSAIEVSISSDTNYTISLKSNENLQSISGVVDLGSENMASGWIEASNQISRTGVMVNSDGFYEIGGLLPSADYNYTLEYTSWEFENLTIVKNVGTWTIGDLTNQDIQRSQYTYKISGDINYSGTDEVKIKAMLVKYNRAEDKLLIIAKSQLDENSTYSFSGIQPIDGFEYFVCAGVKISDEFGTHYNKFNATNGDENLSNIDTNETISITYLRESI
jgi:hypothetical protein